MRLLLTFVFLTASALEAAAKLNIIATTADLGSIVSAVGGDLVSVTTLARPTEDAHFVEAKPSYIAKLSRADALVEGGAELETGWLPALLEQARNPRLQPGAAGRITCNAGVSMLDVPSTLDRSKGDVHAAGNPHFLTDPANAGIVATNIAEKFAQLDPRSADVYRANLERFTKQLEARLAAWEKLLAPYRGQRVAAYHDSWPYFARRFGLRIDLFLEPKPGIPPTPQHLARVILQIRKERVQAILIEPYQGRKTADTVAAETGAAVVEVSQYPGGVRGTEGGYIDLINHDVQSLARALSARARTNSASPGACLRPFKSKAFASAATKARPAAYSEYD